MSEPDHDVKRAAELKLWLEGRISELEEELGRLRETLGYVDSTLRASTFRPANEMMADSKEAADVRELKQDKGSRTVAMATITRDALTIEPAEDVLIKQSTPPFKTYFVGKILEGMKTADQSLVSGGKLAKGLELKYDIEEENGLLTRIIVENYREKGRLNDIISKASWTFSKMLEK